LIGLRSSVEDEASDKEEDIVDPEGDICSEDD
jgi:hypothetical protein